MNVCEGTKISISSSIVDTDLVKLVDASYFSSLGYDIYNDSNSFYIDVCTPASINGNDITLEDRKKYYSTSDISLCNESCTYSSINYTTKRFICECDAVYNSSDNSNDEDEGHISSREYFLSFINYKITTCYKLFLKFSSYYYNVGFYIAIATTFLCTCGMIIFIRWGLIDLNKQILNNIPNKLKLKQMLKDKEKIQKRKMSTKATKRGNNNPPKSLKLKNNEINNNQENTTRLKKKKKITFIKIGGSQNSKKLKFKKSYDINDEDNIYGKQSKVNNINTILVSDKNDVVRKKDKYKSQIININKIQIKKLNINDSNKLYHRKTNYFNKNTEKKSKKNLSIFGKNTSNEKFLENSYLRNNKIRNLNERFSFIKFTHDDEVDKKEYNMVPLDHRNYFQMLLSVLFHEVKLIDIFYYRNPYNHLSLTLSIYIFELCIDLALNCLLYTDDVVSKKYHNNGQLEFIISFALSCMSNILTSFISFAVNKLVNFADVLEFIIKDVTFKKEYFLNIIRFKKYLAIKLVCFYLVQIIINSAMCYYLMIFCTIYHKTQGSIMINYLLGIGQSMLISFGLTIIISLMRYLSLTYRWRKIYNVSKYLFEKF